MRRYLVVANRTLGGEHLLEEVRRRMADGPCTFHLVVPAPPPRDRRTATEGQARSVAAQRLEEGLAAFRDCGAECTGEVGDIRPMDAIADSLRHRQVDEIIVSTLPPGLSMWLRQDLPHRVARVFGLPVSHVVLEPAPAV